MSPLEEVTSLHTSDQDIGADQLTVLAVDLRIEQYDGLDPGGPHGHVLLRVNRMLGQHRRRGDLTPDLSKAAALHALRSENEGKSLPVKSLCQLRQERTSRR